MDRFLLSKQRCSRDGTSPVSQNSQAHTWRDSNGVCLCSPGLTVDFVQPSGKW